ncbi:MAG: hypothetical protein JW841_10245 [Deltaproteobacteria bacterium]|nr:hypothetical protein [Deltaproteobacteria bacterium]
MSPEENGAITGLMRLRREISEDINVLEKRQDDAQEVLVKWGDEPPAREYLVFGAVAIHGWYTALESLCERIAREIDQEIPQGEASHRLLLSQAMTELPDRRPAIIDPKLATDLLALLSFRHFFRHAYAVDIDHERLQVELRRLMRVHQPVLQTLSAFDAFLIVTIDSIRK